MNSETKVIKSNFEYLRKLFIMPDSPDKFIEFGHELLEMIHTQNRIGWEIWRDFESAYPRVVRGIGEDKVEGSNFRRKRR